MKYKLTCKWRVYLSAFLLLLSFGACQSGTQSSGEHVIHSMYQQWNGHWPDAISFEQAVQYFEGDAVIREVVWYEVMAKNMNLLIRVDDVEAGEGYLFSKDTLYVYLDFEIVKKVSRLHELMVLLFEVYHQDPNQTISQLTDAGFALQLCSDTVFYDKPMWIVGTQFKDEREQQFWVDKADLLLYKMIVIQDGIKSEVVINKYESIQTYPVATEISFYKNNDLFMKEIYYNVQINPSIPDGIFSPDSCMLIQWPY